MGQDPHSMLDHLLLAISQSEVPLQVVALGLMQTHLFLFLPSDALGLMQTHLFLFLPSDALGLMPTHLFLFLPSDSCQLESMHVL